MDCHHSIPLCQIGDSELPCSIADAQDRPKFWGDILTTLTELRDKGSAIAAGQWPPRRDGLMNMSPSGDPKLCRIHAWLEEMAVEVKAKVGQGRPLPLSLVSIP
jgi:hypothetical protein